VTKLRRALFTSRKGVALGALFLACTPARRETRAPAPSEHATLGTLRMMRLNNGLQVIMQHDPAAAGVSVNVWYMVGSAEDPPHRNGFAHLFEHLMLKGTPHIPTDTLMPLLESAGATDVNETTDFERTNFFETVPPERLNLALWVESERMSQGASMLSELAFRHERDVVESERHQLQDDPPYGMVPQILRWHFFDVGHPYFNWPTGTPADLDAATLGEVTAFHSKWYVPNNASMVICGRFDVDRTVDLVRGYFKDIPRGEMRLDPTPEDVVLRRGSHIRIAANVAAARVVLLWPSARPFTREDAALDLLVRILRAQGSELMQAGATAMTGLELLEYARPRGSFFMIQADLAEGNRADEAVETLDSLIHHLTTTLSTESVQRAKLGWLSDRLYHEQRTGERANLINAYLHYAGRADFSATDMAYHMDASREDLARAVSRFLDGQPRLRGDVVVSASAPRAGVLIP
jgi:zinc protease